MITRWLSASDQEVEALIKMLVENGAWLEPTLIGYDVVANPSRYRNHRGEAVWEFYGWTEEILREDGPQRRWPAMLERAKDFVRRFHEAGGLVIVESDGAPLPGWGTRASMGGSARDRPGRQAGGPGPA